MNDRSAGRNGLGFGIGVVVGVALGIALGLGAGWLLFSPSGQAKTAQVQESIESATEQTTESIGGEDNDQYRGKIKKAD